MSINFDLILKIDQFIFILRILNKVNIDAKKHNQQLAAAALSAAASSSIAAAMASSLQNGSSAQTAVVNSNISINYSNANANNDDEEAETETTIKHQKYFSGKSENHQIRPIF